MDREEYRRAMCRNIELILVVKTKGELETSVLGFAKAYLGAVIMPFLSTLLGSELVSCPCCLQKKPTGYCKASLAQQMPLSESLKGQAATY